MGVCGQDSTTGVPQRDNFVLTPNVEKCPVGREYNKKHSTCRACPIKCNSKDISQRESKPSKQSKYKNQKVTVDGIKFDSKKEANRYRELRLMVDAGVISDLELQPVFELVPKQDGERAVKYVADFQYRSGSETIVEDVKSPATKTPVYGVKRKLMLFVHGIKVREV